MSFLYKLMGESTQNLRKLTVAVLALLGAAQIKLLNDLLVSKINFTIYGAWGIKFLTVVALTAALIIYSINKREM